jgi:hypothetical protein
VRARTPGKESPRSDRHAGRPAFLFEALPFLAETHHHLEGSVPVELAISGLMGLVFGVFWVRQKVHVRDAWPRALLVGAALLAWRGGYALLRYDVLSRLFAGRLRTIDVERDVNLPFLAAVGGWVRRA